MYVIIVDHVLLLAIAVVVLVILGLMVISVNSHFVLVNVIHLLVVETVELVLLTVRIITAPAKMDIQEQDANTLYATTNLQQILMFAVVMEEHVLTQTLV